MKKLIAVFASLVIAAGSAHAMCGKKVTTTGTLKSSDKSSKTITIQTGGSTKEITLTPNTEYKDAAGKPAKLDDFVGKSVSVIAEHDKADSVTEVKKG
jgi:hypothetical protein